MSETEDFLAGFFADTEGDVYFSTFPNIRDDPGQAGEKHIITRSGEAVKRFLQKWDRERRGMFFTPCTIQPGALRRSKEAMLQSTALWSDIDLKDLEDQDADVVARLRSLPCPPSVIVSSGRGYHPYWLLKEAVDLTEPAASEQFEGLLRRLCDLTGGDPAVAEKSRVMRLPGSHHSKDGGWIEVKVVHADYGRRYEVSELEDMCDLCAPILRRKVSEKGGTSTVDAIDPFMAAARAMGYKPSVDIEARLSAMSFGGVGDSSVHQTQLSVTASMLTRGEPVEKVVETVLYATQAAAGEYGARWNWRGEDRKIRRMCQSWIEKHGYQERKGEDKDEQAKAGAEDGEGETEEETPKEGDQSDVGDGSRGRDHVKKVPGVVGETPKPSAVVVSLKTERDQRKPKPKAESSGKDDLVSAVCEGAMAVWRSSGGSGRDLMFFDGEAWVYHRGLWHAMTAGDEQVLRAIIRRGFVALGEKSPKNGLVDQAWRTMMENPDLTHEELEWNKKLLICQNVALDPITREVFAHNIEHRARVGIGTTYDPDATCPNTLTFLASCFLDRDEGEADALVGFLQEFFGAALAIRLLSREQRKAMILLGKPRTGKSEITKLLVLLLKGEGEWSGAKIATPSVKSLGEGRFSLAPFLDAAAWARDDAINEGDILDPQLFKTIVTGEPIDIERKGRDAVSRSLAIPVLLNANALPSVRDSTGALFERSYVVEMGCVVSEDMAEAMRRLHNVPAGDKLVDVLFRQEGPGILNWALDGLARLLARGRFAPPPSVVAASESFKEENSPVQQFVKDCCQIGKAGSTRMVARADLLASYNGWLKAEHGALRPVSGKRFFADLKATVGAGLDTHKVQGVRYQLGLHLTDDGLHHWEMYQNTPHSGAYSTVKSEVNKRKRDGV